MREPAIRYSVAVVSCVLLFVHDDLRSAEVASEVEPRSAELKHQLKQIDEKIDRSPNSASLYYKRAMLKRFNDQPTEALSDLTKFIRLQPLEPRAFIGRGGLFQELGENHSAAEDFSIAVKLYTDRIEARPPSAPDLYIERADAYLFLGRFEDAIRDLDTAHEMAPKDIRPFFGKSKIFKAKKEYDEAIDALDAALRIDPANVYLLNNRGGIWSIKHDYKKAIADYSSCIECDQSTGRASTSYVNRALAWRDLGNLDNALKDVDAAIRVNPDSVSLLVARSELLSRAAKKEAALSGLNEAISRDPFLMEAYLFRAELWNGQREYLKASRDYEEAAHLKPYSVRAVRSLAHFLATCPDSKMRDARRAISLGEKLCERTKWEDDSCLEALALANSAENHFERAIELMQKAMDLGSETKNEERSKIMLTFKRN